MIVGVALAALRLVPGNTHLDEDLEPLEEDLRELTEPQLRRLLEYIFTVGSTSAKALLPLIDRIGPHAKGAMVMISQAIRDELAEGLRDEVIEGLRDEVMAGVRDEVIEKLRDQLTEGVRDELKKGLRSEVLAELLTEEWAGGRVQGQAELVIDQMSYRFGALSDDVTSIVRAASPAQLKEYSRRLFTASSADDVVGG
ncbi:DUF4351 domain-containing protein [Nocardia sp. alder85J]|uniref:DUF4351 domain-containing protein n=1 Tax=Nocardia sp. alder85J TaxID=2862949 RepID=UPI001CD4DB57|nr:DUF4351 domain-containing protein [Nocardia sp. alder85J]MCX4098644.1 DUF4351 domain-containing protein [Nocardia sp. alder85J]